MKARAAKKLLKALLSSSVSMLHISTGKALLLHYPERNTAEDVENLARLIQERANILVVALPRSVQVAVVDNEASSS